MNWKIIRHIDTWVGIPLVCVMLLFKRVLAIFQRSPSIRGTGRILLVKFWGIGNICMMLPSIRALQQRYPEAELDLLTLRSNIAAAGELRACRSVYSIDTEGAFRFLKTTIAAVLALREKRYNIIIDFEQFARISAIMCSLIGNKITIGFKTARQHRHYLYTDPVAYDDGIHTTQSYFSLVQNAGAHLDACVKTNAIVLPLTQGRFLASLGISPNALVIVLHVGTSDNFKERRWPAAFYAELADLLIRHHAAHIVLTGLAEERALAAAVLQCMCSREGVLDVSGTLSFKDFFCLIGQSDLVISADTAAVHIASAVGTPVVGLYGPNTPLLYGPWGENSLAFYKNLECSPCITNFNAKLHVCQHPEGKGACMKKISAEEVYKKIKERYFDENSPCRLSKQANLVKCIL